MIFNVLLHASWSPDLSGARVIDLPAGSGALGIEALSRGAAHCLFVDRARAAISAIETNIATLGLADRARFRKARVEDIGCRPEHMASFELAFLDLPYGIDPAAALSALAEGGWLSAGAVIVVETGAPAGRAWQGYRLVGSHRSGAAHISFLLVSSE